LPFSQNSFHWSAAHQLGSNLATFFKKLYSLTKPDKAGRAATHAGIRLYQYGNTSKPPLAARGLQAASTPFLQVRPANPHLDTDPAHSDNSVNSVKKNAPSFYDSPWWPSAKTLSKQVGLGRIQSDSVGPAPPILLILLILLILSKKTSLVFTMAPGGPSQGPRHFNMSKNPSASRFKIPRSALRLPHCFTTFPKNPKSYRDNSPHFFQATKTTKKPFKTKKKTTVRTSA